MSKTSPKAQRQTRPARASATKTAPAGQDADEAVKAQQRRAPRLPTGKSKGNRRSKVDPVERFKQLADAYKKAGEPNGPCKEELSSFLAELSDADEQALRKWWAKLPKVEQDERFEIFRDLDDVFGPAAKLMRGIHEDKQAFQDTLPAPPPLIDPEERKEWMAGILSRLPEEAARAIAAEPWPSDDDVMRDLLQKEAVSMYGDTPEAAKAAEDALAEARRREKWYAVTEVVAPAENAAKAQVRNEELRKLAPQIANLAAKAAQDLAALLVTPGNATMVRDQVILPLGRVLERARLVADSVPLACVLVDCIAMGEPTTAEEVAFAARSLAAVADEAGVLVKKLARSRGKPPKPALDAAVALNVRGLDPRQIATVLDRKDLRLDPAPALNTPAHYRRAIRNRLKRPRADTK